MIRISDDFECGAVEKVRFVTPEHILFRAPLHGSPQGMWFAFRISEAAGRTLTFELGNVGEMLGCGGYGSVRPVVREGRTGEWRRVEGDRIEWNPGARTFRFTLTPQTDDAYVAYCYPYGPGDLEAFVRRHADSPHLRLETLCKTGEGRDFPVMRLGDWESPPEKQLCVLLARQHAGEVPGSFVLEGILDAFLSDTEEGRRCRERLVFLVAPLVDLDGVAEGRYGKDRPPRDFNRDWCARPVHPEIGALISAIDEATQRYSYRFFVDLHAPAPGDVSFWLPSRLSYGTPRWEESWSFGKLLEELAPEDCPVRVEDYTFHALNWSQELYELTSTYFQAFRYGVHSGTLEITYHRHAGGEYVTPVGWRALGRSFLRAMKEHLDGGDPAPFTRIEKWGVPPPHLEHWTFPATPRGVQLVEHSPTHVSLTPAEENNLAWITSNRFFACSLARSKPVEVLFQGEGASGAAVEVILYAYVEGLPTGDRRHLYLEPGTFTFVVPAESLPTDWESFRLSFRVTQLAALMEIRIQA